MNDDKICPNCKTFLYLEDLVFKYGEVTAYYRCEKCDGTLKRFYENGKLKNESWFDYE